MSNNKRNGVDFNKSIWGNTKGVYVDKENNAKTQFSTTKIGQIDRYEFNSKGEHNHYGINSKGEHFEGHKSYKK